MAWQGACTLPKTDKSAFAFLSVFCVLGCCPNPPGRTQKRPPPKPPIGVCFTTQRLAPLANNLPSCISRLKCSSCHREWPCVLLRSGCCDWYGSAKNISKFFLVVCNAIVPLHFGLYAAYSFRFSALSLAYSVLSSCIAVNFFLPKPCLSKNFFAAS